MLLGKGFAILNISNGLERHKRKRKEDDSKDMGLDTPAVKFLCAAKSMGVDFSNTATIGRQSFFPDPLSLRRVFSVLGVSQDAEVFLRENPYGEAFFSLLGARRVNSMDCSNYEEATILHDMNTPISGDLHGRFSLVHDGGTLEHVFNTVQGLQNCMEMVRVGGHFSMANVANNFMGHGFWQFSPDLIYRVFSPVNGFRIKCVLLHEAVNGGAWYWTADPAEVRSRVELRNSLPTYIMALAQRVSEAKVFAHPPQQSDYTTLWEARSQGKDVALPSAAWRRWVPSPLRRAWRRIRSSGFFVRRRKEFNPLHYRRIADRDILRGRLDGKVSSQGKVFYIL